LQVQMCTVEPGPALARIPRQAQFISCRRFFPLSKTGERAALSKEPGSFQGFLPVTGIKSGDVVRDVKVFRVAANTTALSRIAPAVVLIACLMKLIPSSSRPFFTKARPRS